MDDVKTKIAKLMAMAQDGRGNEFEMEAALRQAQKLMLRHGIDIAEIAAASGQAPRYDWVTVNVPAGAPHPVSSSPLWFGFLITAIAEFTDCHIAYKRIQGHGICAAFSGDNSDVQYAVWICKHLRDTIRAMSARYPGDRADRETFRKGMVRRLSERMAALRKEAREEMKAAETAAATEYAAAKIAGHLSGGVNQPAASSALALVDNKIALRNEQFGRQRTKTTRVNSGNSAARQAGAAAGDRVGFGRPIGQVRAAMSHGA